LTLFLKISFLQINPNELRALVSIGVVQNNTDA